jgi:hypothetical protein
MSLARSSVTPLTDLDKLTYINIGAHGKLNGKLHTAAADIDSILAFIRQANTPKIVLHFHGGLVSEEAGELTAQRMVPLYKSAGSHPVVFIWETGFLETVEHNLGDIQNTKLFKKILAYAVQQLAKRLNIPTLSRGAGQREDVNAIEARLFSPGGLQSYETTVFDAQARGGAAQLSSADVETIQEQSQAEIEEQLQTELAEDEVLTTMLTREVPSTRLLDPDKVAEGKVDAARGIISIAKLAYSISMVVYHTAQRYLNHRDHGFGATVVEETLREFYMADFGAWVWSGMKAAAQEMWSPNPGLTGDQLHGGRYLLEGLSKLQLERPSLIVDLVGHSAGSIAICMMLKTADSDHIPVKFRNLILMAPACTSTLFHGEIALHPERYQQFRMFTMTDDFETANHLLSIIYNRSLLYLISGVLESDEVDIPIAGMMRFDTGKDPFTASMLADVRNFLSPAGGSQRNVLARTMVTDPSAASGFRSNAARHQDFNTDADTQDSLVEMIK